MKITQIKYRFLINQHKNRIMNYALYILQNKMDAEDATQETMIKLWENMGKFQMSTATAYIMKIAHNKCIDIVRKRNSVNNKQTYFDDDFIERHEDTNTKSNPMNTTHLNMVTEKLKIKMNQLPENLKSVFILYEINGLKYKEISEILDMPINSVKVNLLRARKSLQNAMKDYELQEAI